MEHRRQKISLLAAWTTKSANPYFIVYYSFTVVPMIGTSGADNWFMTIIGSLRYICTYARVGCVYICIFWREEIDGKSLLGTVSFSSWILPPL